MSDLNENKTAPGGWHPRPEPRYPRPISAAALKEIFSGCADFEAREVIPALSEPQTVTVCWIDGVVSGGDISEDVLRPLTDPARLRACGSAGALLDRIQRGGVYSYSVKRRDTLDAVAADLTQGFCAVVSDGEAAAVTFEVRTRNSRAVAEPTVEKSLKGGKDSFVETLRVNTSLVRRRLRTPELKLIQTTVGRKSGTTAAVLYVEGVTREETVRELQRRLDAIDIDGFLSAGDLEQYVTDDPNTPFPQLIGTERPDRFAMALLDGRVGVLVDGLPTGFLLPATLSSFMSVPEDRSQHFAVATALTLLRWLALILTLTLPAFLVAVTMYHQEMIPTSLLLSMVEAEQRVPFGVALEVICMLAAFELLQEAGLRLPNPVGQTVSIIGALIVGQSAVEARVVSPVTVIVVALSGIAGYSMPSEDLSYALRLFRFALVLAAVAGGLFGLIAGAALLIWHLCTLESFGVAYTSPMTDSERGLWQVLVRLPLRAYKYRDPALRGPDRRRQK